MLSKDASKLLKWLSSHDRWMTTSEIKREYKKFDSRSLNALIEKQYVGTKINLDDGEWRKHRITEDGKAYLEGQAFKWVPELRDWITVIISLLSFLGGALLSEPLHNLLKWIQDLFA